MLGDGGHLDAKKLSQRLLRQPDRLALEIDVDPHFPLGSGVEDRTRLQLSRHPESRDVLLRVGLRRRPATHVDLAGARAAGEERRGAVQDDADATPPVLTARLVAKPEVR